MPFSASVLAKAAERSLASSAGLRAAKLAVRFPGREFTGREMAEMLGVSHTTLGPALQDLLEVGLLDMRVVGRAHVYRANRDSYLFPLVQGLVRFEKGLDEGMLKMLGTGLRGVAVSAVVFGSYARGTPNEDSDLDLLVVVDDLKRAEDRLASLEGRFMRKYGVFVSTIVLSRTQFARKAATPYIRAAMAEGVLVAGRPLREVAS
jgi:predicted nucleotidyltransferase